MTNLYYDANGKEYTIDAWETGQSDDGATFLETIPLRDYPYDDVWLCPRYSREWTSESPIIVVAQ